MDDTQKYLNEILKKRMGSVVNYGGNSKNANTVTRIPKQQQKIQNMPTVFRKKHQTVYVQGANNGSYYSQAQSQYLSMKQGQKINQGNQMPQQNRQTSSQRVEYMLISKRLLNKKQDDFISPTVDVTKYSKIYKEQQQKLIKKKSFQQKSQVQKQHKSNYSNLSKANNWEQNKFQQRNQQYSKVSSQENYNNTLGSKMSNNTDKSKRKKIFEAK